MIEQLISSVMMLALVQMLPKVFDAIGELCKALELGKWLRSLLVKQYKYEVKMERVYTQLARNRFESPHWYEVGRCMLAIQHFVAQSKTESPLMRLDPLSKKAIPHGKFTFDSISFEFYDNDERTEQQYTSVQRLTLRTDVSQQHLDAFIKRSNEFYDRQVSARPERYFWQQKPEQDRSECRWLRLPIQVSTDWNSLYYPEKQELQLAVDQIGPLEKLVLLLHGPPGTGKTSTIRAIANSTNRHIVNVDLTLTSNNQELLSILFGNGEYWRLANGANTERPEPSKSIFVFEEIDTQLASIAERGQLAEQVEPDKDKTKTKLSMADMLKVLSEKITLGGLLTALDGILELHNVIVIMTTNHPEKLDPRLIRAGRVTHEICLGPMLAKDAKAFIGNKFPEADLTALKLEDDQVLPSKLAQLLHRSTSFQELVSRLKS